MAHTIDIDGTETEVSPRNGKDFKLIEMYNLLDTNDVEIVATKDDRIMVHGVPVEDTINEKATALCWLDLPIYGKVLVCERTEVL